MTRNREEWRALRRAALRILASESERLSSELTRAFYAYNDATIEALRKVGGPITSEPVQGHATFAIEWQLSSHDPPAFVEGVAESNPATSETGEALLRLYEAHRRAAFASQEADRQLQSFVGTSGGILTAHAIVKVVRILDGEP